MKIKSGIIAGIVTLVIGGTAFNVSRETIVENFSKDTGMSKQESEQYVDSITEDDMVEYSELGADYVSEGQEILDMASEIDCINYYYEWETESLSCERGILQWKNLGNSEIALGKGYIILSSKSASTDEISYVIKCIDDFNKNLNSEIVKQILDYEIINELKKNNSFNKALLQAALDSNK